MTTENDVYTGWWLWWLFAAWCIKEVGRPEHMPRMTNVLVTVSLIGLVMTVFLPMTDLWPAIPIALAAWFGPPAYERFATKWLAIFFPRAQTA